MSGRRFKYNQVTHAQLKDIQALLDGENASDEVRAILNNRDIKLWLDSWVRGPLGIALRAIAGSQEDMDVLKRIHGRMM